MKKFPGGIIARIRPTISIDAYDAGDILFLTTEIPNAVAYRGGVSKLLSVSMLSQHDATDDVRLIFMENSYSLIAELSPGSSGGPGMSDPQIESSNMTGTIKLDSSINEQDLGGSHLATVATDTYLYGSSSIMLLQAAPGSTSVYVGGVAIDAQDYANADDLDLIFHIQYL